MTAHTEPHLTNIIDMVNGLHALDPVSRQRASNAIHQEPMLWAVNIHKPRRFVLMLTPYTRIVGTLGLMTPYHVQWEYRTGSAWITEELSLREMMFVVAFCQHFFYGGHHDEAETL